MMHLPDSGCIYDSYAPSHWKTPAWIRHRDVRVYTIMHLQVRDTAEVHEGPIESGKYVFLTIGPIWTSYTDLYGV